MSLAGTPLTSVIVCPDPASVAERAMDLLTGQLAQAVSIRGVGHLSLTGGSTAVALLRLLAHDERARRLDWSRIHVWQGDERFVPTDHPESNWAIACREWLDVPGSPAHEAAVRHPMPVAESLAASAGPDQAAARYAEEMVRVLPSRHGLPALDVMLLGVGSDAHIHSAFPGSAALLPGASLAMGIPAPGHIEPHLPRVTLGAALLEPAGLIVVMVPGAGKAEAIARIFRGPSDPLSVPAQLAVRPNAVWLLDAASADGLRRPGPTPVATALRPPSPPA